MKKTLLLALAIIMIASLASAQTTKVIFGTRDGDSATLITADTAQDLTLSVWIRTTPGINVVGTHMPFGTNDAYIDPASRSAGDMLYPFPLWENKRYLDPNEDTRHSGYTNQSILAVKDLPRDPFPGYGIQTEGEWWEIATFGMTTGVDGDGQPHDDAFILGWQQDNGGLVLVDYVLGELDNDEVEFEASPLQLPNTQTGIEDEEVSLPDAYSLAQNYPNPFNASTTISYNLPNDAFVTLEIYDIMGRKIETLVSEEKSAGSYSVIWNADRVSSGVYMYRIVAGDYIQTKRCNLLK